MSLVALVISVAFPLYLERRRERREDRLKLAASFQRLANVATDSDREFQNAKTAAPAWRRWHDIYAEDVTTPGSCLWRDMVAYEKIREVSRSLDSLDAVLSDPDYSSEDIELLYEELRPELGAKFGEIFRRAGKTFTETESRVSRRNRGRDAA